MGLFGGIKNNWKKSEAAVIVQNLLEIQQRNGFFDMDPARFANALVEVCWNQNAEKFDGRFGQRPHKFTIAAYALTTFAAGAEEDHAQRMPVLMALGMLLGEVEKHGVLYPFSALDQKLLSVCTQTYLEMGERMMADSRFQF